MSIKVPKEADVLRDVLAYLALARVPAWRNNTGAARYGKRLVRFGVAGMPDVVGILPGGRFLGCEVKRPGGGRLSDAQAACLDAVREAGGLGLVVRSVDDLRNGLRAEGVECP